MTEGDADQRPLSGRRVLVTRPRDVASELVSLLTDLGAEAVVAPLIRIDPPEDPRPLQEAATDAHAFDAIVFTSRHGVDAFVRARGEDAPLLDGVLLCAVGPGTAARLATFGYRAAVVPDEFRAETLLDALTARGIGSGARVLVPRADIGRDVLTRGLRDAGAEVTEVIAYRTVPDAELRAADGPDVAAMLRNGAIDAVTFTSGSAVMNFARAFGREPARALLERTVVATIGPVTTAAARELGIAVQVEAPEATLASLVRALAEHGVNGDHGENGSSHGGTE
jgi:uroporphyrinogen III methyltransferase / synthase